MPLGDDERRSPQAVEVVPVDAHRPLDEVEPADHLAAARADELDRLVVVDREWVREQRRTARLFHLEDPVRVTPRPIRSPAGEIPAGDDVDLGCVSRHPYSIAAAATGSAFRSLGEATIMWIVRERPSRRNRLP